MNIYKLELKMPAPVVNVEYTLQHTVLITMEIDSIDNEKTKAAYRMIHDAVRMYYESHGASIEDIIVVEELIHKLISSHWFSLVSPV